MSTTDLARPVDEPFPLVLTTGRVLSQFLSGNQTRRISHLDDRAPVPILEVHPLTASRLGLDAADEVTITSRVGASTVKWSANDKLREDTVFLPYHWVECNRLVASDLDPTSKIPGFKYTPVRLTAAPRSSCELAFTQS